MEYTFMLIVIFCAAFALLNSLYKRTNAYKNRFFYTQGIAENVTYGLEADADKMLDRLPTIIFMI